MCGVSSVGNAKLSKNLNQAENFRPAKVLRLFQNAKLENQGQRGKKGRIMNPLIQQKTTPIFLALALVGFGLSPSVQSVTPPPDGGYLNGNTAEGDAALLSLTDGGYNTAIGWVSLKNTTSWFNTAVGAGTLYANSFGGNNTAIGVAALLNNTSGSDNTANGSFALQNNATGNFNTAVGSVALANNDTTGNGLAVDNTAVGFAALYWNTDGFQNTAIGVNALSNSTGNDNTALGNGACVSVTTASGVICIGSGVVGADVSNTTWIGNVYGVTTQNTTTAPVVVSADGQLGTVPSSERFKKDIATMNKASEAILSLRPVTFHYKRDTKGTPQFGLIAEEVAKVNPALVLPDKDGKPYTVRYDSVNAMLLNEFIKEHQKVQRLEAALSAINERLDAQGAKIEKVNARVELTKPSPQTVLNNQ